jgi:hypothetical protein
VIVLLLREPIACRLIWLLAAEAEAAVKNNDHMRAIAIQITLYGKIFFIGKQMRSFLILNSFSPF